MSTGQLATRNFYQYLPLVYDAVGLSDYAANTTGVFLEYIQTEGWLGRRVLDIGCGTGASAAFFIDLNYMVYGVDISPGMLSIAQKRFEDMEVNIEFEQADLRVFKPPQASFDLVFGLNVMNYVNTVRDLEGVFRRANYALDDGKMLLFDLLTVYGLAHIADNHHTQMLYKTDDTVLVVEQDFDYDVSALIQDYTLFYNSPESGLQRYEEYHVLRGYSMRAVESLLERSGFRIEHLVDTETLSPVGSKLTVPRVLVGAVKVEEFVQQG